MEEMMFKKHTIIRLNTKKISSIKEVSQGNPFLYMYL